MELTKGMLLNIQSYKHNQQIHRVWKNTKIISKSDNILLTAHNKTRVIESNGRSWYTKEPALCYFYDDTWFNVIVMFKKDGIYYYCNLSSPYIFDGEGIKYIDYDLDVKVFPDGTYRILDENEYAFHSKKMNYSQDIKDIVSFELEKLLNRIINKEAPFNNETVKNDYKLAFKQEKKRKL